MINATEMAKPFGKRPGKWLELPSTKEFLRTLSTIRKSDSEFVKTINGGTTEKGKGTWMHEDVALEFARWLSPAFAIWCNDRIKELLLNGTVSVNTPKKKEETPIDLDKYGRVELAELLLESDGELGDALEELERKKEEVAVLKYRISQMEKGVQPSADNRMEQRLERLEKMVAALVGGQRPMKAWKDTDISEMEHSPEYYSEFPNYEYVSYLTPTPAEVYRSMDLEDVRIRLWKDTRIEMSPRSLQKYLCANGYLEETANERLKPTRQAEAYGYVFASEPEKDEKTGATVYRPLFTEKGYLRLIETIKREGVKP